MKKTKRYEEGGDIDALEAANQSDESQAIANESKGEAMLKAMRDEAAKPKAKPMAKPAMPKAEYSNEGRSRPAPAPKNPNYSNEGRSMPAPTAKPSGVGRASVPMQTSPADRNPITNESLKTAQEKWAKGDQNTPSALSRLFSGKGDYSGSQRNRAYKKPETFSKGGSVSASRRADGIAQRGKTKGRMI
jgi:hypothetical protein